MSHPDLELAGVVTSSVARRSELQEDNQDIKAFDSLDDLIADGIDDVVISVSPEARYKLILKKLES